jgi:hypothetical protein
VCPGFIFFWKVPDYSPLFFQFVQARVVCRIPFGRAIQQSVDKGVSKKGITWLLCCIKKIKNHLTPDTTISAADMVLCKELAGRAETTYFFH